MKIVVLRFLRYAALIAGLSVAPTDCFAASPQPWIEVLSPHFIVVSNAKEHDARRVAERFELIRAVFQEYFGNVSTAEQPVIILAAKDEETLKPLLPDSWTKKGAAHRTGLYLNGPDKSYVGLRLDASLNESAYEPYEPIYHEYVHHLMRRMTPNLPLWMVEGLAEFFGNIRVESSRVLLGAPSTSNVFILRQKPPLPLNTLYEVNASSPYYNEENKVSIFYAQSWALTHYLVVQDWREKTHRMNDFVALLEKNVPQPEAARRTIGDPGALEKALREYILKFSFLAASLDKPKIEASAFMTHPISNAESLAVRADFMAHEGRYTEAQSMLEESLKADPKLVAGFESMSFLSYRQGKTRDAEKWSQQALELDPKSYLANYYYGWSLLRGGSLDDNLAVKAEASLRAAIKSTPGFVPAYAALAVCLSRPGPRQKLDEAHEMILTALDREPGNMQYRIGAVEVLERMGRAEDAVRAATLATSLARTPEEQGAAGAALAGARQFQVSQQKMKELGEERKSEEQKNEAQKNDAQKKDAQKKDEQKPFVLAASVNQDPKAPGSVVQGRGPLEVLTDTMGVDFGPYLKNEVLPRVRQNWYSLIPESASWKKGRVVLEFYILKNGAVSGLKVAVSSGDVALDRPAFGSITGSNPFPTLPNEFPGKYLGLRFSYYYNLNADGTELGQKKPPGRECTHEGYLAPFLSSDAGTPLSIWPTEPVKVTLDHHQKFLLTDDNTPVAMAHWEVTGEHCKIADCGSVSELGLYTAPATMPPSPDLVLTVTETHEPCKTGSVRVTLIPAQAP